MDPNITVDAQSLMKSFDMVSDLVKQLITLSTGIVALTVTFLKDVVRNEPAGAARYLRWAWTLYVLSMLSGILALMAVAGTMGRGLTEGGIYQANISRWVGFQIGSFMLATVFVVVHARMALRASPTNKAAGEPGRSAPPEG